MEKGKNSERRAHKRFLVKENVHVLAGSNTDGKLYHVIDISRGGLSFRYPAKETLTDKLSDLSILLEENLWLDTLPVRTASDTPVDNGHNSIRRRGVQFGELSYVQNLQLETSLQKYITNKA